MRGLTSHVLDTLRGTPARGVAVTLLRLDDPDVTGWCQAAHLIATAVTNDEGRCQLATELDAGDYELRFDIGSYFSAQASQAGPSSADEFLTVVPVRFRHTDPARHMHIPLVASPWSYATYRGGAPKAGAR
jgi:hydroxyisourate hydrolase